MHQRTAVETGEPLGVDIESDELIFFPLLYWPVPAEIPPLSASAVERINRYLRRRHDPVRHRATSPASAAAAPLRPAACADLLRGIDMPPLVPVPPDHVLTKSFYLLHDFPGR